MGESKHTSVGQTSYRTLLSDSRLLMVLTISAVGTMGSNVMSPALPAIANALSVSEAHIGLLMTAYTLPAMVCIPLTGVAADMYGRRTVILPALVVFGAAGIALAVADSFKMMLLLRAIQGAAVSGFMPLTVTLLGDLYSGATGATAQGLRVGANGFGGIVLPSVAGVLSGLAWNYPFLLYGIVLLIVGFGYVYLPETTDGVDANGKTGVRATLIWYMRSLRAELTDQNLAVLLTGGFARDFPRYAVITFVPLFAVKLLGASFAEAGMILSIRGAISLVVSPFAGPLSKRISNKWALISAMVLSATGIAFMVTSSEVLWLAAAVGIYGAGDSVFSPVVKDTLTKSTTDEYRSGVVGGMQLVKYAAQTASPTVFGLVLAVAGFDVLFASAAAITATYAVVVLLLLDPI